MLGCVDVCVPVEKMRAGRGARAAPPPRERLTSCDHFLVIWYITG